MSLALDTINTDWRTFIVYITNKKINKVLEGGVYFCNFSWQFHIVVVMNTTINTLSQKECTLFRLHRTKNMDLPNFSGCFCLNRMYSSFHENKISLFCLFFIYVFPIKKQQEIICCLNHFDKIQSYSSLLACLTCGLLLDRLKKKPCFFTNSLQCKIFKYIKFLSYFTMWYLLFYHVIFISFSYSSSNEAEVWDVLSLNSSLYTFLISFWQHW